MNKIISLCLTLVLVLSLVACGGQGGSNNEEVNAESFANDTTENQSQSSGQPEKEQEETPPADSGETAPESEPEQGGEEESEGQKEEEQSPVITASHSDVTFKSVGSNFKLTPSEIPQNVQTVTYASKNDAVATVAEDGTVTAVAPGTTDIVMTLNYADGTSVEFTCIIRCNWLEESTNSGEDENSVEDTSVSVDLAAFFMSYMEQLIAVLGEENTPHTMPVEGELLDAYYAGLNGIAMKQCVVQMPGIGAVPFEFALIEVENAADVDAVQAILQARVTYQVEGGAWYPATIEGWEKAEIIVNGNYVALIVAGEQQADAVAAFNALFN